MNDTQLRKDWLLSLNMRFTLGFVSVLSTSIYLWSSGGHWMHLYIDVARLMFFTILVYLVAGIGRPGLTRYTLRSFSATLAGLFLGFPTANYHFWPFGYWANNWALCAVAIISLAAFASTGRQAADKSEQPSSRKYIFAGASAAFLIAICLWYSPNILIISLKSGLLVLFMLLVFLASGTSPFTIKKLAPRMIFALALGGMFFTWTLAYSYLPLTSYLGDWMYFGSVMVALASCYFTDSPDNEKVILS